MKPTQPLHEFYIHELPQTKIVIENGNIALLERKPEYQGKRVFTTLPTIGYKTMPDGSVLLSASVTLVVED